MQVHESPVTVDQLQGWTYRPKSQIPKSLTEQTQRRRGAKHCGGSFMYPRSLSIATRLDSPQYQSTKATRINYLPPPHLLACHPAAPFTQGQHLVLSLCTDPRFLRASVSTGRIPSGSAEGSCLPDRPRGEAQDHRRACPHAHLLDWGWGGGGRGALQSPFWVSRSRKPANASAHSAPTREVKLR